MKLKSIFFIGFLLLITYFTQAQQSVFPVLSDTPRWCMVSINYNGGNPMFFYGTYSFAFQKDTLVDGKTYTQLLRGYSDLSLTALIRNEGKKTFIRKIIPNQTTITFANESLLYDFNMTSTNDSILANAGFSCRTLNNVGFAITARFMAADSIVFNGIKRKRIKVIYTEVNAPYRKKGQGDWIEGYGDLKNPFFDFWDCSDTQVRTMALDIKGQRIYQDTAVANGCSPKRVGVQDALLKNVTIYPNPTSGTTHISWDSGLNTEGGTLRLFNTQGQQIINRTVTPQTNQINLDLSQLPSGLYYLSFELLGQGVLYQRIVLSK